MNQTKISHFLFLTVALLTSQALFAQEKTFTEKLEGIQTSSKELTKSASTDNSSVGQSGVLSTSIPLVTVTSRTMSFPLQLNYTSGIKVDQQSGSVGLGWVLPVGSITRDYGAFEPDYSSTEHEGDMKNSVPGGQNGWLNPTGNAIEPSTNNQVLGYNIVPESDRSMPLSDFYRMTIPGMGSNSFWNSGIIGSGVHNWKWTEYENWKVLHSVKTYEIDQEYSRINEINLGMPYSDKGQFDQNGSHAAAIGILPYVINGKATFMNLDEPDTVRYEDFKAFTIVDENGVQYVFGRALRGQKYIFEESPFWSTSANMGTSSPQGSFWKTDYIAEWLLTEIRSADYQDLNNNGIADDNDAGDWMRFEYTEETQVVETVPKETGYKFLSTVPKHREWSSFSQTDQASSLMRERAYLTKIITPIQELDFAISQRYDVEHDYLTKPANLTGSLNYYYEDRHYSSIPTLGSASDFDINYPIESMKYDSIKLYTRLIDQSVYPNENILMGAIVLNYADQGSPEELAVSDYLMRNNDDTPKTRADGSHVGSPSQTNFDIEEFTDFANKRGKTTLLGIELFGGDLNEQEKTSYTFEYAYNPSFSEIHKREIVRKWTSPSVRQSGPFSEPKRGGNINYNEFLLGTNGIFSQVPISYTGLPAHNFLIDFPYQEILYSLDFGNNSASLMAYVTAQYTEQMGYELVETPITNPKPKPIKDVYGYLYAENCEICPQAWSLTAIEYPTGGRVAFEYENGEFDKAADAPNWNVSENGIPIIKDYNKLAKRRSFVQDAYNKWALFNNSGGIGSQNRQKERTATFEVEMPSNYGIRLKKKTIDDRINPQVVVEYAYQNGHFTTAPSEYVQNCIGAFNQFLLRETHRHDWELNHYGPQPNNPSEPPFLTDFKDKMRSAAISGFSLDEYLAIHFYEHIDEILSDDSYSRTHYGPLDGLNTVEYDHFNVFAFKIVLVPDNSRYILARSNLDLNPITVLKTELYGANETSPYQVMTNTYNREKLEGHIFEVDYGTPTNETSLWNNSFEIYYPITPAYFSNPTVIGNVTYFGSGLSPQPGETGFGYLTNLTILDQVILPYEGIVTHEYERWCSFKTTLVETVTNYKGLTSSTKYTYNSFYQLETETVEAGFTQEKYITTYEYAHITYSASFPNPFSAKNMLSAPAAVNTYLNSVSPNNAVNATMTVYDLTSYSVPRIEDSYVFESDLNPVLGTFTLTPFNIYALSNPNWRIAQNDPIEYNKPGQLISGRSNQLFSKTVFGNNLNVPKAMISHPFEAFDATYSGFEDFTGKHSILNWDTDDYQDEKWFIEGEFTLNEPAISWRVAQNPCNNSIPPGENQPFIRELNHVLINNVTGLQIGNTVEIELIGSSHAIPFGYVFEVETTVSGIIQLSSPIQGMQYALCTSDPIIFPEDDGTHSVIGLPYLSFNGIIIEVNEDADWTISETKVTKLNEEYNLSKTYARTGKYSYKLPTQRIANEAWQKTPVRPVKLKSAPPSSDCLTFPSESDETDECKFVYEASVWLKYDADIASIGHGGGGGPKSADIQGDVNYLRGTVSETDNLEGVKIICDVYNSDRTLYTRKIFYVEDLDEDWKQYTIDLDILRGNKWLDVYVQNERSQVGSSIPSYKSVFADDIIIYPKGAKYTYTTYDKFGNETFVTNNNDVYTESVYDQKGRPILQKNAYGNMVAEQEYFEHPNWSNQVNHVTERKWVSNGIYNESRYYLDGFGKTKQAMVADNARNARVVAESNYYNDKGFVTATFKPYALIGSNLGDNYDTDFIFNAQDLYSSSHAMTEVTYEAKPEMKISTMSPPRENIETPISASQQDYVTTSPFAAPYGTTALTQNYPAGSLLVHELTNANGNVTKTYMDNLGRVIMEEHSIGEDHIQNADGSISLTTGNSTAKTWFVYDPGGRLIKVVDPTGMQSTYAYNSLGVVVKKTTPDKGTSELRYDKFGQIRFVRDQKDIDATNANAFNTDQFSYWKYDEWGRVLETGQKQAAPSAPTFTGQLLFDDYAKINNQKFPLTTNALVELHQRFEYDGTRDQFNSEATLCETVYHDHAVNGNLTISAQTTDEKCYEYMADGQVANVTYNYQGLAEHIISYTYNDLRIPIGKRYLHPTESGYNFEWRTNIDNFARTKSNTSFTNGVETQTGQYYYDVLGNLLAKGLGSTGNATDPHLDIHFFKFNIRDQLTHHTSKYFRFGLKHDSNGNIIDQYWSNELFDPTDGATININQYHYYYDEMNRLIGADYRLGTSAENPFANFDNLFGSIPNDFLCGVNNLAVDEYLEPVFTEFEQNIANGENPAQSTQALNGLNLLKVEYKQLDIAYSQMTEANKDALFANYIGKMDRARIDSKAYELYRAKQEEDWDHIDRVTESEMTKSNMKYTQILLSGLPYNAAAQCDANANATVYGFLPTFPYPTTLVNSDKYDAAYWYTENGNITDLNRNDENGVKTELDYSYNTANNQIEDVAWSQPNIQFPPPAETHTMNYDANGNIVNEAFVGPMPPNPISAGSPQGSFTYDDYDELPTSISTASGTRNYRYDSNGQRIVKEVDANEKNYYLDGVIIDQNNEVVSYQTPEGYVSVSNNGGIIVDYFYNVTDWLGTNRVVIDANGNVVNASDHYPFGKRMPDRIMVTDAEGNRYQFTGHEFDEETGFDYHGARYYNSELGRYMNVDPWQEKYLGWSSYNYTMGNPVNYTDPTGKGPQTKFVDETGKVIADLKDGSNAVFVIKDNKIDNLMTDIKNGIGFESIPLLNKYKNSELGNKYGVTLEEYGSKYDDSYKYSQVAYFEGGYKAGYNTDTPLYVDPYGVEVIRGVKDDYSVIYDAGQTEGRKARDKGIMSHIDPEIKNNVPEVQVSANTNGDVTLKINGKNVTLEEYTEYLENQY